MPLPKPYRYANFINTELLSPLGVEDTEIHIPVYMAEKLPTLTAPEVIMLALWDGQQEPELVEVTDNPQTGLLTVNRGQEGTSAKAWFAGTQVKCILSAGIIDSALQAYFNLPSQLEGFYLPITGGLMLGELYLHPSSNPAQNEAVPRSYVDSVGLGFMKADGTVPMTGNLQMVGHYVTGLADTNAASADYAATKQYVDQKFSVANQSSSALYADDSNGLVTTGTADAYIVNVSVDRGVAANWDGVTITIRPHLSNTKNSTLKLTYNNQNIAAFPGFKPIYQGEAKGISQRLMQKKMPYRMTYLAALGGWVLHGMALPIIEIDTGHIRFEPLAANAVKEGYVRLMGGTIGLSAGTEGFGTDYKELYFYNYANFEDAICHVGEVGYVRTTALNDWNLNKPLTLLDMRGRGTFGTDGSTTLAARITAGNVVTGAVDKAGSSGGIESHPIGKPNLPDIALDIGNLALKSVLDGQPSTVGNTDNYLQLGSGGDITVSTNKGPPSGQEDFLVVSGAGQAPNSWNLSLTGAPKTGGSGTALPTMSPFLLGTFYQRI